ELASTYHSRSDETSFGLSQDGEGLPRRIWTARAMRLLEAEQRASAATPIFRLDLPELPNVTIWIKDETRHPSGSLKHRLAHALFTRAICNGDIEADTVLFEASSGSTAISEAWFARRLGLR